MDLQEIKDRFSLISGLTAEEVSPFNSILEDAQEEIESKILDGVNQTTESRRLNAAAAALGFYKYVLYKASNGMESFSAGDITIKKSDIQAVNVARQVWHEAKCAACDILKDDDFLFEQIEF